jgi:hypothetical protein
MTTVSMDAVLALVAIFASIILAIVGWLLAANRKTSADLAQKVEAQSAEISALTIALTEFRTILIGVNGDNGLNSELKRVKRSLRRHAIMLQTLKMDYDQRRREANK